MHDVVKVLVLRHPFECLKLWWQRAVRGLSWRNVQLEMMSMARARRSMDIPTLAIAPLTTHLVLSALINCSQSQRYEAIQTRNCASLVVGSFWKRSRHQSPLSAFFFPCPNVLQFSHALYQSYFKVLVSRSKQLQLFRGAIHSRT